MASAASDGIGIENAAAALPNVFDFQLNDASLLAAINENRSFLNDIAQNDVLLAQAVGNGPIKLEPTTNQDDTIPFDSASNDPFFGWPADDEQDVKPSIAQLQSGQSEYKPGERQWLLKRLKTALKKSLLLMSLS